MRGRLLAPAIVLATVAGTPIAAAQTRSPAARVTIAEGIDLDLSMAGVHASTRPLEPRVRTQDGELYRLIVDEAGYARFAYALRVEATRDGVELVFRPVRLHEALEAFRPRQRTYVSPFRLDSGLSTLPDIQWSGTLRPGDSISLDLFEQPGTGQRVGDTVTLVSASARGVANLAALRARRQTTRPVLTVAGMAIRRGGHLVHEDQPSTFATSHAVMLGLGERVGTVLFSAEPPQNSVPYGVATVQGNVLRFTLDDVEYECTGTEPVGPPGLTFVWMYVLREPLPHVKGYFVGGADSIDTMMRTAYGTK